MEGVEFADGERIDADLVVVAAGIRPNVELGRRAGLDVKRGIVVNDHMETSSPDVFAVGECVEHNGVCYGLVAPLIEQAKVLAATMTGNKGPTYTGSVLAAKLKIMGVEVFSAGDWSEASGAEPVRFEDPALGVYKKVVRPRRPAGRRDSRRRHLGQPSLHGLAARRHRPEGSAPAPALPAAGRGRRARHRADGRQRDGLRLRRGDQGRDHRGHPHARA